VHARNFAEHSISELSFSQFVNRFLDVWLRPASSLTYGSKFLPAIPFWLYLPVGFDADPLPRRRQRSALVACFWLPILGRACADLPLQVLLVAVLRHRPDAWVYVQSGLGSQFSKYRPARVPQTDQSRPLCNRCHGHSWGNAPVEGRSSCTNLGIRRTQHQPSKEA
jgi:hypothetical protein